MCVICHYQAYREQAPDGLLPASSPGSCASRLFVLDTGRALLNVYQLSFVCILPVFSLSYTVSLPFLTFCCQFVATERLFHLPVSSLIGADTGNQSLSFESCKNPGNRTLGFSCFYNQFRIGHPGLFPQTAQYSLFQVTYMVIYPAIFLTR